jgi:uncharacterized iron-regulated membrane protein
MRIVRLIHAWSGALLCLVLTVLGLSGSLLVFKADYVRATIPQARTILPTDPNSLARAITAIERTHGSDKLVYVNLGGQERGVHLAVLKDDTSTFADSQGRTILTWDKNGRLEDWVFDLHRHLLAGDTGELIAGLCALCAIGLCVTGFIVWLPTLRVFNLRVWPKSLARRDLIGSHRNLGAIMALPVTFLALTGATFAFPDQTKWTLAHILPSGELATPPNVTVQTSRVPTNWSLALSAAQQRFPDATLRLVIWPKKPTDPIAIRLRQPSEWNPNGRSLVWIDPATSQMIGSLDALALQPAQATYNVIYPLHAAKMGTGLIGRFVDILTAMTGLSLALLGIIGTFSFLKKQSTS